jgi:hypothetical protein
MSAGTSDPLRDSVHDPSVRCSLSLTVNFVSLYYALTWTGAREPGTIARVDSGYVATRFAQSLQQKHDLRTSIAFAQPYRFSSTLAPCCCQLMHSLPCLL